MPVLHSLLRRAEHAALSTVQLSGRVLDLGGDAGAEYLQTIKGDFTVTTVNLDTKVTPDILHDLETPLPIPDASYDHALLINVLEHIYEARQLMSEAVRVVVSGGSIVVIVPYLFPLHPDPHDYWRFSAETLRKDSERLGLIDIHLHALGSGVFAARFVMLDRLLPMPLRFINYYVFRHLVPVLDSGFFWLARSLGKKYQPETYALGYLLTARKP